MVAVQPDGLQPRVLRERVLLDVTEPVAREVQHLKRRQGGECVPRDVLDFVVDHSQTVHLVQACERVVVDNAHVIVAEVKGLERAQPLHRNGNLLQLVSAQRQVLQGAEIRKRLRVYRLQSIVLDEKLRERVETHRVLRVKIHEFVVRERERSQVSQRLETLVRHETDLVVLEPEDLQLDQSPKHVRVDFFQRIVRQVEGDQPAETGEHIAIRRPLARQLVVAQVQVLQLLQTVEQTRRENRQRVIAEYYLSEFARSIEKIRGEGHEFVAGHVQRPQRLEAGERVVSHRADRVVLQLQNRQAF